jgi:DNA-binding CsgD family transcriptional regulator
VIEAAYHLDLADDAWMEGIVGEGERLLGQGLGLSGYFVDASKPDSFDTWGMCSAGMDPVLERERFKRWTEHAPTALKRHAHLHSAASFASQVPFGDVAPRAFDDSFELTGRADVLGISALDSTARGCGLAIPCPTRQVNPPAAAERLVWERLAAHLGSALRLRRQVGSSATTEEGAEAVLTPAGRVEHAEGEAATPSAREALRHAALRFDRARTRSVRRQPLEATGLWLALVAGRWTLVDHFERGGRRYIVARPNPPRVEPMSRLTVRETRVTLAAALGHSNKMIAYELGIAPSTVSGCLLRAASKLGVADRAALIRLVADRVAGERRAPSAPDEN